MDQNSAPVRTDMYAALPRAMELATEYLTGLSHRPVAASTSRLHDLNNVTVTYWTVHAGPRMRGAFAAVG